jgi:hypothetical protein
VLPAHDVRFVGADAELLVLVDADAQASAHPTRGVRLAALGPVERRKASRVPRGVRGAFRALEESRSDEPQQERTAEEQRRLAAGHILHAPEDIPGLGVPDRLREALDLVGGLLGIVGDAVLSGVPDAVFFCFESWLSATRPAVSCTLSPSSAADRPSWDEPADASF